NPPSIEPVNKTADRGSRHFTPSRGTRIAMSRRPGGTPTPAVAGRSPTPVGPTAVRDSRAARQEATHGPDQDRRHRLPAVQHADLAAARGGHAQGLRRARTARLADQSPRPQPLD